MCKIAEEANAILVEIQDPINALEAGHWRQTLRDGKWVGKILLQCSSIEGVHTLYNIANGRGVCVDGIVRTIEVTSPTDVYLAAGHTHLSQPMVTSS